MGRYDEEFRRAYAHGTFVLWPPDDIRERVNRLRQRYDPASRAVCDAHITLTQPFLSEPGAEDWQAIEAALEGLSPFTVSFGPLASFLPYPCAYLEIRPRPTIMRLRAALHETELFNLMLPFSDDRFVPHMSVTDGYPDEPQTRSILAALAGAEPGGSFLCDQIAYIQPDAGFHFDVKRTLPLRGHGHGNETESRNEHERS